MKQKISVAARPQSPKDLSRNHYTTLGFGMPFPIFVEETIPKDKFNIRVSNFSRIAPQFLPNLGTLSLKIHAFYVPFRLAWQHFDNFQAGLPSWTPEGAQVFKNVPLIDDRGLTRIFEELQPDNSRLAIPSTNSDYDVDSAHDFQTFNYDGNGGVLKYQFTAHGKAVYHMLTALGYNFAWIDANDDVNENKTYSALPLLCWLKLHLDYFIPSQFQPSSYVNRVISTVNDMSASSIGTRIDIQNLSTALYECALYYQNNYFTSAWQSPNAPVSGLNNIGTNSDYPQINSIQSQGSLETDNSSRRSKQQLFNNNDGVAVNSTTVSSQMPLTSDGINFMQKFARYVRRSNFAGSRAIERILARFGVRVDDFAIGMCRYLGSDTVELQKSEVVVTGSEQEAGSYAGMAWFNSRGSRTFKCDCDLPGMIIITASIETPSAFVSGVRRRNYHIKPLDFYTPELDGGTMQAISGSELFGRLMYPNSGTITGLEAAGLTYDSVFGYSPRYSEYKMALSDVTGDFNVGRLAANIDPFILPRRIFDNQAIFTYAQNGNEDDYALLECAYSPIIQDGVAITPARTLYPSDMYQFNRIFRDTDGFADPIFSVFKIDCIVNSSTIPLNESSELIGKGKLMEFETNGMHLS